jgi:hypothetical protein
VYHVLLKCSVCTCFAHNLYHVRRRLPVSRRALVARFDTIFHLVVYFGKTGKKKNVRQHCRFKDSTPCLRKVPILNGVLVYWMSHSMADH